MNKLSNSDFEKILLVEFSQVFNQSQLSNKFEELAKVLSQHEPEKIPILEKCFNKRKNDLKILI